MQVGAATAGVFLVAYVLAMEMVGLELCSALYSGQQVGPRWRVVAGTLCQWYQVPPL